MEVLTGGGMENVFAIVIGRLWGWPMADGRWRCWPWPIAIAMPIAMFALTYTRTRTLKKLQLLHVAILAT